jgi:hypothetical protein
MRPAILAALALGLVLTAATGTASAQSGSFGPYGPIYRPGPFPRGTPGLSPYLDLTRGGNRAANFFLGTVPEIERRRNAAQFGAAISDLERKVNTPAETGAEDLVPTLPGTGHPVAFMNTYPYFNLGGPTTLPQTRTQQAAPARKR